jgi:arylsulfatase A-like enzyme
MGRKGLLYDLSVKIPCFIHDPAISAELRGRQLDQLVSTIDITTTILDYGGIAPLAFMDGTSLRPLVEGRQVPWRSELFLESLFTLRDNPFLEGIRTEKWKYIRMFDGTTPYLESDVEFGDRAADFEQLVDLESDPGERQNLVSRSEHGEVLVALRQRCVEQSRALNQRRCRFQQSVHVQPRKD